VECQSLANKLRRNIGRQRTDGKEAWCHGNNTKRVDDEIKLLREIQDGVISVNASCRPISNQFVL